MNNLLFYFEEMAGMRINYNKSEICTIGLEENRSDFVAKAFNCKKEECFL